VDPELHEVVWLLDGLKLGCEQPLEHIGQMSHVELIMEVLGGLSEASLYLLME